jgi:hypothetical protein
LRPWGGVGVREGACRRRKPEGIEYQWRRLLADRLVVAVKLPVAGVGVERRGRLIGNVHVVQPGLWSWEEREVTKPKSQEKSFAIPRRLVWEAWRRVKANKGAPGGG